MKKIFKSIIATALVMSMSAPAVMASDLEISGNGAQSDNKIVIEATQVTEVSQTNSTVIMTTVMSDAQTGENTANNNTGGDTAVVSGDATVKTKVTVEGSSNTATVVNDCGCLPEPTVLISGNGYKSKSKTEVKFAEVKLASQHNGLMVGTMVGSSAKTGKNKSDNNTGGSAGVMSGSSFIKSKIMVSAPSNVLNP